MKAKRNGGRTDRNGGSSKDRSLEPFREHPAQAALTTDQGVRVHHTDDSLKAGQRGPTLLEDFHLREKITRFDHERIPERVVHARGSAAHGFFQVYESMAKLTRAGFLQDPRTRTPVPSPALSMTTTVKDTIKGRVIAALVAPGVAGRELWIESLGMPAVIPPPEEEKEVKTAIGAARAKQARKEVFSP